MKQDVSRLSVELTKLPSVSSQLKIDELSILGKLAVKGVKPPTVASTVGGPVLPSQKSVITQAKGTPSSVTLAVTTATNTVSQAAQQVTQASVAVGTVTSIKTSTASAVPVTTSVKGVDRMIVLPSTSKVQLVHTQQHAQAQPAAQVPAGAKVQSAGTTYTIGVPQYVDGSTVYQAVPVVPGQQVVYWSPGQMAVVQQQRSQASTTMTTTPKTMQFAVAQPKQATPTTSVTVAPGKTQKVSVITIE